MTKRPIPGAATLVFVLGAVQGLVSFSYDMYMPAVPAIRDDFGTSMARVQMTMAVVMAGNAVGMLFIGVLSDRVGRRPPALVGGALYVATSIGCAIAGNVDQLIALRFLQALAVVSGVITVRALVSDLYEPREMARFTSLMALVSGIGPIIAPGVGGVIFTFLGWRAIFWILAAYGVVVLASVYLLMPETRGPEAQLRARAESPFGSYLAVFSNPRLMRFAIATGCMSSIIAIYVVSLPPMLIERFGVAPAHVGFYFGLSGIALITANQVNRRLLRTRQPYQIAVWGLRALACMTTLLLGLAFVNVGPFGVFGPVVAIMFCFPFCVANLTALTQGEDRGRGGAVASVAGATGAAMGAVVGAICSAFYDGTPVPMAIMMCAMAFMAMPILPPPAREPEIAPLQTL